MAKKSPDTKELETLIDQLQGDYDKSENGAVTITVRETEEILAALKWTSEYLGDRKLYHKTQQKKKAIVQRLIKEHLSEAELRQIDAEAKRSAEREVE